MTGSGRVRSMAAGLSADARGAGPDERVHAWPTGESLRNTLAQSAGRGPGLTLRPGDQEELVRWTRWPFWRCVRGLCWQRPPGQPTRESPSGSPNVLLNTSSVEIIAFKVGDQLMWRETAFGIGGNSQPAPAVEKLV